MIIVHYAHRLPADYDLGALRRWLKERGTVWDAVPALYFKAFLLREAGRFGAIANNFSSLYLWQQDKAFRDWLVRGGYKVVTDVVGRAGIETYVALDAFRGRGSDACFLYRDDIAIPLDADLTAAFAEEIERARDCAAHGDIVAAVVGLDPQNWKFVRVLLSEDEPGASARGTAHQIAHLSCPLL
ncbi:DUF4865 family protein, partial [Bradyrhizobium sp.]